MKRHSCLDRALGVALALVSTSGCDALFGTYCGANDDCPSLNQICTAGICVVGDRPNTDAGVDAGIEDLDAGAPDAGVDAGRKDAGVDAGVEDAGVDAGGADAGVDAGAEDAGVEDAGLIRTEASSAIAEVREGNTPVTIVGAFVTDIRVPPVASLEVPGFFLQAEREGPAIFVEADPSPLSLEKGDEVSIDVLAMTQVQGAVFATSIGAVSVLTRDNPVVAELAKDVSDATNLISNLDSFESELVSAQITVGDTERPAGAGYQSLTATTEAITNQTSNLVVRFPDSLANGVRAGCSFRSRDRGLWRSNATAQISVFQPGDMEGLTCPPASISTVVATSSTEVSLVADFPFDAATILPDNFSADAELDILDATAAGNIVTLTTSAQVNAQIYTLTVDPAVRDTTGTSFAIPNASFAGFTGPPPELVMNEVVYDNAGPDTFEFIEFVNTSGGPIEFAQFPFKVLGINGTDGNVYAVLNLNVGTLAPDARVILGKPDTFAEVSVPNLTVDFGPDFSLQNGAPDGFVLVGSNDLPVEAFFWEGEISSYSYNDTDYDITGITTIVPTQLGNNQESSCRLPDTTGDLVLCSTRTPGVENAN